MASMEFMRIIYFNHAELFYASEALHQLNSRKPPQPMEVNEGRRMSFGDNPFLVAAYVKDFENSVDFERGIEILTWTRPPGSTYNRERGRIEDQGIPVPRRVERPCD